MFDFQMSSVRSVSIVGAGGGVIWEGRWRRRVDAGSWRMGKYWQGPGKKSRRHGVSKEQEASVTMSESELGEMYKGKAGSKI